MKGIVTYHSIDNSGSVISTDEATFRRHAEWLGAGHVPVVSVEQLLRPDTSDGIAITFDDAFRNVATTAAPLLQDQGLPATVFVPTRWVGSRNEWDNGDSHIPALPLMDWSQLGSLAEAGIELGSHSESHPDLTTLDGERLAAELTGSRDAIESETGKRPRQLAYPYGHHNATVVAATGKAGYSAAHTTRFSLLPDSGANALELPRLDAYYFRRPGTLESWGSPRFERYVRMRAFLRNARETLSRVGFRV